MTENTDVKNVVGALKIITTTMNFRVICTDNGCISERSASDDPLYALVKWFL